ncbi:MAG: hypothetical protein KAV87_12845 [Desulfobacteraceae bacterium]|nr:hypothetical protein [Desulfobacteraceae bacterium]
MINRKQIEDNEIIIPKDFLLEQEKLDFWDVARKSEYSFSQESVSKAAEPNTRWVRHIKVESFVRTELWKRLAREFKEELLLTDVYFNCSDFATKTLPHNDNENNGPSILVTLNQEWERKWAGYTVFFESEDSKNIVKTVCPIPGQVVIFNGSMYHYALPPSQSARYPRRMLAIKTVYKDVVDGENKAKAENQSILNLKMRQKDESNNSPDR